MSDPMNTRPADLPPENVPRKSSSPLIWILVLIALIALGWYFYNRHAATEPTADLTPPAATSDAMTPTESSSVEKTAAETRRKAAAAKRAKTVAKAASRSREVALIGQPTPSYPPDAYRAGEEGTVVVMAQVDAMGNASDVAVVKRSGSRVLDRAATSEVRKWKFTPAMKDGKAVASSIQVPVDYKLGEQQ
jgi:periplasmic protein TonB